MAVGQGGDQRFAQNRAHDQQSRRILDRRPHEAGIAGALEQEMGLLLAAPL
jgi:hypothetical protein